MPFLFLQDWGHLAGGGTDDAERWESKGHTPNSPNSCFSTTISPGEGGGAGVELLCWHLGNIQVFG